MEGGEGSGFDNALMKKRRSSTARRARPEGNPVEQRDTSSSSSMSSRSNSKRLPSDENVASDRSSRKREYYLNGPAPEHASKRVTEGVLSSRSSKISHKTKGSDRLHSDASGSSSRKSESGQGIHVSAANRDTSADDKPRKVKLKIGGINHSIPAKPNAAVTRDSRSSPSKPPRTGDSRHQQKSANQAEGTKDSSSLPSSEDKKTKRVRAVEDTLTPEKPAKVQIEPSSDPVRKSRRLAKKSILDSELDDDYDTSILEDLGTSDDNEGRTRDLKSKGGSSSKKNVSKKDKSKSTVYEVDNDFITQQSNKDDKKRLRESTDGDNTEEEPASDSELEAKNKKQKEAAEPSANVKSEPLTTRRRALQSWMDGSSNSTVEFPDGLPPASSRSKKEKLSEAEMIAKKAEAAQRRKMQVEKATKESEAEAIRKILGLDSDKKEERKQKEREEKERAAREQNLAGRTIRWVMGPTGTVVSFPDDIGLPSIFNSKPCSYPPPREKCAGPSCTNAYRYRDSKLKLPLCSLKCYKAVHGNA